MKLVCFVFLCITSYVFCIIKPEKEVKPNNIEDKRDLPPCQACRVLTNSFKKGIERTAREKFEGGDASWEESRLKTYSNSEIRLAEIEEKICSGENKAAHQCHVLAEQHELLFKKWWFKEKNRIPDIYYYLCIDELKVCCPENHYGPNCKPCAGGLVNPCNGHGHCKGAGTRKGSGQCRCDSGYIGELCDACKVGYYNNTSNSGWLCLKCDKSCKGHCREAGPKGCEICASGFQYSVEYGCLDLNECVEMDINPCKYGTFCANSVGSFQCIDCDKACDGCNGDGPDMCYKCAEGYIYENPLCIENKTWPRSVKVEVARYATYLGLCVATCIILRRNIYLASIIGFSVAIYIGLSEYTIGEWDKRSLIKSVKSLSFL